MNAVTSQHRSHLPEPGPARQNDGDFVHPPVAPPAAAKRSRRRPGQTLVRVLAVATVALVLAVGAFFVLSQYASWSTRSGASGEAPTAVDVSAAPPSDPFPLTPVSSSPFKNTGPEAKYVGSEACQSCHEGEHESFRHSGMGRSMAKVDLSREPPDGQFDHPASQRRYQVLRRDGWMWHRELLLSDEPNEVIVSEYPVKYVTGSGRHSLTYLVETDGFLVESPITWYSSRQAWGMSPGYDRPENSGFQREVGEGCLICHAGRAEAIEGSLHRMKIIETSIGCERCHGPGSLHVDMRTEEKKGQNQPSGDVDHTIVNPAHLSRELAEAVCQQCHLRASATVVARGRKHADFRPGLPLQDFRQDYWLDSPDKAMTVVGHVEQMHLSRCFKGSSEFTCVTCHSPHGEPPPQERIAYYKSICLTCHEPEKCTVAPERLAKESADNNCVQCHMPTSPTDIPHLAFTHHRVGIHDQPAEKNEVSPDAPPGVLKPFLDVARMSEIDQKRSLGLAYLDLAIHEETMPRRVHYQQESLRLLTEVRTAGLKDGFVDASLASLRFDLGLGDVLPFAQSALADGSLTGMERSNALFLIADSYFRHERYEEAIAMLEPLKAVRRHSLQWLLRAQCETKLNDEFATAEALLTAVRIDPRNPSAHRYLANYFRKHGSIDRALWHEKLAK